MQINLFSNAFDIDLINKINPGKALKDILNFHFLTSSRNSLCEIENQTLDVKCFAELGLLSLMLLAPPAVAPVLGMRYEHMLLAMGQIWPHRYDRKSYHLFENPISTLSGVIFPAEYSCSLLCSPTSFPSGKPLVNNRFLAEGLWGDNPFSSPANIFFGYY